MLEALKLAEEGRLTVSPNPIVGCVIVKNNQIIGKGFHQFSGGAHAEILALNDARNDAFGATLYVTLEPCCHHGKTPPCTQALIDAGIKTVYVACIDPNPKVSGKGIRALKSKGIEVNVGMFQEEAIALNEIFFHYMTHQRPFVIAKWAMSLDGKTTGNHLDDKQITGLNSEKLTHDIRQQVDAILVGANTVLYDNPKLTARNSTNAKQPVRIVLAGQKYFPDDLNLCTHPTSKTIIVATKETLKNVAHIKADHVQLLLVPENMQKQVHLPSLLEELGKLGISSLLVEGGMTVHKNFLEENLINKMYVYLAPKLIASFPKMKSIEIKKFYQAGDDFHFIAAPPRETHV
jgi:diaminohydroxyphosphoribosylaminopyrimidine deaminase/5-amino-6-(5-phosphoribosylamino)uracil reductase